MNKDVIGKALYFTAGLGIGGGTVYFVVRHRYRALAEEEIASVKDSFQKIADTRIAQAEADWRAAQPGSEEEVDQAHAAKVVENQQYVTVSEEEPDNVESVEVSATLDPREELHLNIHGHAPEDREVTVSFAEVKEEQNIERDPSKPYEIDVTDFVTGVDLENVVWTYWEGDSTLVDERDEMITDPSSFIGDITDILFTDERKKRHKALYVRNEDMNVDFEIIIDPRSFSKVVLGVDDVHADDVHEKQPIKKMRSDE